MPLIVRFPRAWRRPAAGGLLLFLMLHVEGCYYMQAVRGHSDLMSRRRPIADVIADNEAPDDLKRQLELVREARDFSVSALLLPDNDSYRLYADLERDYAVWNVFAAAEFSLQPKTWCYPVAGCVAYRGYFSEQAAREMGEKLSSREYDVAVGGVSAYSTLGRFSDPVLNTMMRWSDIDLVATMFHELAHQKLYIKGDSAFNESFATAVAEFGIQRWLGFRGESQRLDAYLERKELRRGMMDLMGVARSKLEALYAGTADQETMRAEKQSILDTLSADAETLIESTGGQFTNWLAAPLNNARLVSLNLYEGRLDAFRKILDQCADDLACFYTQAGALAELGESERNEALDALAD